MRLLLCLDGTSTEHLLATTLELAHVADAPVRLVHVLDSGHAEQAGFFRDRYVGRSGLGSGWQAQLDAAARERGEETLREASARLAQLLAARSPSGAPTTSAAPPAEALLLAGRPEQEIVRLAREWPASLIALCARRADGPAHPPGPHSVGHVARFVLDHAPCPVLLVRG
jgi:nucleotide-binding universal stress UspA family protein